MNSKEEGKKIKGKITEIIKFMIKSKNHNNPIQILGRINCVQTI